MYVIKNSMKNVVRNIKRYLIVGVLIFIISTISVIAMIVNQSSQETIQYYLNLYGSTATIDINPEEMSMAYTDKPDGSSTSTNSSFGEIPEITYDDYVNYADSKYVESVTYQQLTSVFNDDLITSDSNSGNQPTISATTDGMSIEGGGFGFSLVGSDTLETSSFFADNANILVDGQMPVQDLEVLISTDLAAYNNLSVGDSISFGDYNNENMVELTICGLYQPASSEQMMMGVQNNIFTNYNSVSQFTNDFTDTTATYTLTSYDVVDEFEAELYDKGLDEIYYVNNNQTLLQQVIGPVQSTIRILNNLLIIVFLIGGAILIFINLLILRERRYEIGVLRALGMKANSVTKGLIIEMIIVAVVAMILATAFGIIFAQPISDALISSNTVIDQMPMQDMGGKAMNISQSIGIENQDKVTTIDAQINIIVLAITFVINMLLIMITTLVASRFINRQHPNNILREQ